MPLTNAWATWVSRQMLQLNVGNDNEDGRRRGEGDKEVPAVAAPKPSVASVVRKVTQPNETSGSAILQNGAPTIEDLLGDSEKESDPPELQWLEDERQAGEELYSREQIQEFGRQLDERKARERQEKGNEMMKQLLIFQKLFLVKLLCPRKK